MGMNTAAVQRLYVAYFNRPADPVSLAVYEAMLPTATVATQAELLVVAETYFSPSSEFTTNFEGKANSQIVDQLYQNIFGRTADAAGLIFWATALTDGSTTVAELALQLSYSAQGTDAAVVAGRIEAATEFTDSLDTAAEITGYSGDAAAASGRAYLAQISGELPTTVDAITAEKDAAVVGVDASIETAVNAGNAASGTTFTLTAGFDSIVGTANNDQVFGAITGAAATTTLDAGDQINGAGATDTLNLTLSGGNYTADAALTSIEKFSVSSTGGARSFDADGLEGMELFTSNKSSQNMTVTNLESVATKIGINKDTTANTTSITWKSAALAAADDTVAIELSGVAAAEIISLRSDGVNDIENVTIASNGTTENFMGAFTVEDNAAATLSSLTITGSANLDMDAAALEFGGAATTSSATFDASAMTGRVLVDLDETTNLRMTASSGTGDDVFDFGDSLDAFDTVDMGDGADRIVIDSLANSSTTTLATTYNVSNTETFQLAGLDEASITINAAGQVGLVTVSLMENADGGNNNGDTYTVAGLAAGVTVQLNNIVNARDANTVSLALADASGSEDTLTFITAGTSGHGTDNNVDDVAFTDVETLSIVSASVAAALGAAEVNTIDDISADTSLTTINVSGAEKTTLTLGAEMTNLATFDGSAAADNVTVDATGLTSATTFKGGSGADTFTLGTTLNASDTIEGGTQAALTNDTLTATITGLDAVTGALNVSGVEVLGLTNNGVTTINAASITGASTINLFASSDTTTFTNLAAGSTIGLGQTGSADQVLGAVNVGLADETGSGDVINFGVNEATSATLTATAIETANFGLSNTDTDIAEASLTVSALNVSTINVSGAAADVTHTLNLNTLDADTATVDASAYRGVLTVQTSGTATSVSVRGGTAHDATGGAGDDTFTVSSGTAQYNVDGGAGTDSLAMTLTNGTLAADDIVNFETSSITVAASADVVVDLATGEYVNDNDFTTLTVTGGNGISTFVMGGAAMGATGPGADAIGIAAGTEATGLTLIDGSGFAGGMGLLFGDGVLDNSLTVRGGAGTDTVSAAYAGGTDTIHLENVEILRIQSDATSNVDLTDTVGLARVFVDDDGTAAATTLTDLADGVGVFFSVGAATSSLTIDMENALGATDSLNVELVASTAVASTLTVTNVETLNLDVEGANFSIDLGGVTMATAAATSTLNITGDNSLTISGTDTDIRTIDASGMVTGGAVVQTGREATGASTYTGSLGNDTFIMMSPTDVLAGGGGSDTLDINYAAILGGLSVDLSSTTDQIVSWNGSAAAGTVTGFENADATGYTGTFGALLVGNTAANSLLGTANNDQISGSSGIDTLAGNDGADTIDLGADTDADNYLVAAITDGAALADDESVEADTVNNFVAGTDDIQIAAAIVAALGNTAATNALPVSTNAQNGINKNTTDSDVFVITTAQDDLDDLSDVIATIGTVTTTAGDDFFVVVNNTAGTQSGLYYVEGGGANSAAALTAGEIALVGIINTSAALGVGDVEIGA